ncbi:MAG: VC_2705 family sodium/solute symporter, partial [Myxococcota bacterium]|nr:VC_2705 family sodium/solute symporter [Myxococcota bacterium]
PQLGFGSKLVEGPGAGTYLLEFIDELHRELGFPEYTAAFVGGKKSMVDVFAITLALMVGTAGLPHVIIRFYTVKNFRAARWSALWALLFIGMLYTSAPAVAVFARANLIQTVADRPYTEAPDWLKNWEKSGLIAWVDKDGDGEIDFRNGKAFKGKPIFKVGQDEEPAVGPLGQRLLDNELTDARNELYVDRDIIVLANPEIADLPAWVVALVAAGALAAALSTAAGLLLVISSAVAHDLGKRLLRPEMSEKEELRWARLAATAAVVVAGYLGINPPGFVAQVVAFAFGLAASSFFPVIVLGIFSKRATKEAGISGMLTGILFTGAYIIYFKFVSPESNTPDNWLWGISPEGIGTIGMVLNFAVMLVVSRFTPPPPPEVQAAIEAIRSPTVERLETADEVESALAH